MNIVRTKKFEMKMNFGESGRFQVISDDEDKDVECKVPLNSDSRPTTLRKYSSRLEEELLRYRRVLGGNRISLPNDGLQRNCAHKASKL